MRSVQLTATVFFGLIMLTQARAQYNIEFDGADGELRPFEDITIDLAQAGSGAGAGTYDAEKWAIIFQYQYVNIPSDVTVTFTNHPSGAPVVWLSQGNVTIDGTVILDGRDGENYPMFAEPGPGGFRGGRKSSETASPSSGFGPGAGKYYHCNSNGWYNIATGAGYGTPGEDGLNYSGSNCDNKPGGVSYGNLSILPLIGGSGGSGNTSGSGGAGGGAILIAAIGNIVIDGAITAKGGQGYSNASGGSGGAIKLVGNVISGGGTLDAIAANNDGGGEGRIRLEATQRPVNFAGTINPPHSEMPPNALLFPPPSAPTLHVSQIDEYFAPTYPDASVLTPDIAVFSSGAARVIIAATGIPTEPEVRVTVHVTPEQGESFEVLSSPLQGNLTVSTADAFVQFPHGIRSEIRLTAEWQP